MLNRSYFENSRTGGISVLEVLNGRERGEPRRFVPLKRTELGGAVAGPLADLRLVQTYGYTKEQCDVALEAVYRFPLPGDAAVTGVTVRFGEVEIQTQLEERVKAEADYEEARDEGRQAALLTRESPDVFTLQVTGLQPDQDIVIETRFVARARTAGAGWTLRVPLTTAPRYVREDERGSPHAKGQPLALLRDPGHRFAVDLRLESAESVSSATHAIATQDAGGAVRVTLEAGEVVPDRDFVLAWRPQGEQTNVALDVLLHAEPDDEHVYFMALLAPPTQQRRGAGVAREVILLLDRSGSMAGAKWEAADWAVESFLAGLTERDRLAFARFHSQTFWMEDRPLNATDEIIAKARAFLEDTDRGGTNLGVALEQALDQKRSSAKLARHVLVITDAQVSDAGRLLRLATAESRRQDRRRISVLCIDAAPNSYLANQLAERGGGVARFLTSSPEAEDITTALEEVLADWAEPALADLRLEVDRHGACAAGYSGSDAPQGWSGIDLGDLPMGRPRWLVGRVPKADAAELEFRLAAGGAAVASKPLSVPAEGLSRPAVKALFGARRIAELEFLMASFREVDDLADELRRLGYDPDTALESARRGKKVYAENVGAAAREPLKELLVRESLDYGLASAETAFIAVRSERGERVEGSVFVGNALPAGWSEDFLPRGPRGSAAAPADALASSMSLLPRSLTSSRPAARALRDTPAYFASPPTPGTRAAKRARKRELLMFSGVPAFEGDRAVLFDSTRDKSPELEGELGLSAVSVRFPDGSPAADELDPELCLLIFVGDLASPRARVRLADLVRRSGKRPLNIHRAAGDVVVLALSDPAGAWRDAAPAIELKLHC